MVNKHECNSVIKLVDPLFQLVFQCLCEKELVDDFRQLVERQFDLFEKQAINQQIAANAIQEVKYALASFIDEMVLKSHHQFKHEWMTQPLQLSYFGEHLAGDVFFDKLDKLRLDPVNNLNVLDVFYTCLQLGFEGKYRRHQSAQLTALKADLKTQIQTLRGDVNTALSPEAIIKPGILNRASHELPLWMIASITFSLLILMYLTFSLIINRHADHAANKLTVIQTKIERTLSSKES